MTFLMEAVDGAFVKCETKTDLEVALVEEGWNSPEQFYNRYNLTAEDLVGKWFEYHDGDRPTIMIRTDDEMKQILLDAGVTDLHAAMTSPRGDV